VSLPSKIMSLSIGPFPNGLPVGPYPSLLGPNVSPKSFWDIWDLSDVLSSRVALCFQWVLGHARLPANEWADLACQNGATLPVTQHVPCPLALTIAKIRHTRYSLWRRNLSHNFLSCRFLQFPRRNWPFPVLSAVNCLDFAATVTAFPCPLTYAV